MNALQKPLRMADLPGKVYSSDDNYSKHKPKDPNSVSGKLRAMQVGDSLTVNKSSHGMISRISRAQGVVFTSRTVDYGVNLRVTRIK